MFHNNTFGLYGDDLLAVNKSLSRLKIEKLKKNAVKTVKYCGPNISIEADSHTVNYIDVSFDLPKNTFLPYRKPYNL